MSYRVITEQDRGGRSAQIVKKVCEDVYGVRQALKTDGVYLSLGIEWTGEELKDAKRFMTQFLAGDS